MIVYKYFVGCESYEAVKVRFRELAKTLHPDKATGNHEQFCAMKAEYDILGEGNYYPLRNIKTASNYMDDLAQAMGYTNRHGGFTNRGTTSNNTWKEEAAYIDPKVVERERALAYFNSVRQSDSTFDLIDGILQMAAKEGLLKMWVYQELGKQWDLTLDHYKYLAFMQNDPNVMRTANELFRRYKYSKV